MLNRQTVFTACRKAMTVKRSNGKSEYQILFQDKFDVMKSAFTVRITDKPDTYPRLFNHHVARMHNYEPANLLIERLVKAGTWEGVSFVPQFEEKNFSVTDGPVAKFIYDNLEVAPLKKGGVIRIAIKSLMFSHVVYPNKARFYNKSHVVIWEILQAIKEDAAKHKQILKQIN